MNNIKINNFIEIIKQGWSLDHIYIIEQIDGGNFIPENWEFPQGKLILQRMVRNGLLTVDFSITSLGKAVVTEVYKKEMAPLIAVERKIREVKTEGFERWWKAFPGTDTFKHQGKLFTGTRSLRISKDECKVLFDKIIKEGYTVEELIAATEYEVMQKMNDSIKRKENIMRWMKASPSYLRQRTWEPFIELIKAGHQPEEIKSTSNSVDV